MISVSSVAMFFRIFYPDYAMFGVNCLLHC